MIESEIIRKKRKKAKREKSEVRRPNCKFLIVNLDHKTMIENYRVQLDANERLMMEFAWRKDIDMPPRSLGTNLVPKCEELTFEKNVGVGPISTTQKLKPWMAGMPYKMEVDGTISLFTRNEFWTKFLTYFSTHKNQECGQPLRTLLIFQNSIDYHNLREANSLFSWEN